MPRNTPTLQNKYQIFVTGSWGCQQLSLQEKEVTCFSFPSVKRGDSAVLKSQRYAQDRSMAYSSKIIQSFHCPNTSHIEAKSFQEPSTLFSLAHYHK